MKINVKYNIYKKKANGLSTFFINAKQFFNNGSRILPRNPLDCTTSESGVFNNFILAEEYSKTFKL